MWFLQILGMIAGMLIIKYREKMADIVGEADWMKYFGGVYNMWIIIGVFIFFWSVAALTGTTQILFAPVFWFVGGAFTAK